MPTYYLSDTDIVALTLEQLVTSAPSTSDEAQCWTVDKKASPNFCVYKPDTFRPSTDFVTTEPTVFSQLGYRLLATLNGSFASGNWILAFKVKCNQYFAQTGYVKFRLWRSVNANGSGATQITPGWQSSVLISFTGTNQYKTGTITWAAGSTVTLSGEYLFLEIEWAAVLTGGNNSAAVYWVHNEGAEEKLDTPTFTAFSTYNESLSLSGAAALTDGRSVDMALAVGLTAAPVLAHGSIGDFMSSCSFSGSAALAHGSIADIFAAQSLSGALALAPVPSMELASALLLGAVSGVSIGVVRAINPAMDLASMAGMVAETQLDLDAGLSLASDAGISDNKSLDRLASVTLPGVAAIIETAHLNLSVGQMLSGSAALDWVAPQIYFESFGLEALCAFELIVASWPLIKRGNRIILILGR